MATSTKISQLSTMPSVLALEDLVVVVDDPTGSPSTWRLHLSTLKTAMVSSLQTSAGWISGITSLAVAGNASSQTISTQIIYASTFSGYLGTLSTMRASSASVGGSAVLVTGGALGMPSSGTLTNCTGYTVGNLSGAGALASANSVNQGTIDNSSVGQGELKSTSGDVSATSNTAATLPGGAYGFYTRSWVSTVIAGTAELHLSGTVVWTSAATTVQLQINTGATLNARQQYIQASPPYNLGDGDIPLFIFLIMNGGNIQATYVAEDPPWANNGPTNIRADQIINGKEYKFDRPRVDVSKLSDPRTRDAELAKLDAPRQLIEITQAIKQADMPIIPHPFTFNDLTGKVVVMLDPVSAVNERLQKLLRDGESIPDLIHGGYFTIDNIPLARATPPGVNAFAFNWK